MGADRFIGMKTIIVGAIFLIACGIITGLLIADAFGEATVINEETAVLRSAAASKRAEETDLLININSASADELMLLPGVGEKTAEAIIEYRTANGDFESVAEIMAVQGIGSGTFAAFEKYITVE